MNNVSIIENNCIAANTKSRYNCSNYNFIVWLYDKREELPDHLHPELYKEIDEVMNEVGLDEKKRNKKIRAIIVAGWLEKMIRGGMTEEDEGERRDCPVVMSKVTYQLTARYMAQKKRGGKYLSKGTYCGIRSGIINLFTMSNTPLPPQFREQLCILLKGFKRTITEQRVADGATLEEGKDVMSFACYKLLCKKFCEGARDEYNFAHLFLTLEWNLMARSDNIVNLNMSDFEWNDDSLIVFLRKSKTDQEGTNSSTPFHLYANPVDPSLSVVLALGIYLLSNPGILEGGGKKLFPADYQYNRYANILNRVIKENKEEFERIGVRVGSIGTHSARKGAATHAASGCTVSPAMAAICNRAQWKMGGTRDKYIKFENAGDQFLGRSLTGLNSLQKEFSISPPFFNTGAVELEGIDCLLRDHVIGGRSISAPLFEVLRMCFASVVFHLSFLMANLDEKNRLRSHPLVNNLPEVSANMTVFDSKKIPTNNPFLFFY